MQDWLQLKLMQLIPKNTLSRVVGCLARSGISKSLIPIYARSFQINLGEAEKDFKEYPNLLEFFIRRLKPGLRPINEGSTTVVSPVDGRVAALGQIEKGKLFQAKDIYYTVSEVLGGDAAKAERYTDGYFLTIYLSPRDYHRIHMPLAGKVQGYTYVPGTLFPVNPFGVRAVKGLFAKNERLITYLETQAGEVALVKVGATIVGSVRVVYDGVGTNVAGGKLEHRDLPQGPNLVKGEELGRFEFGSTVILLFEPGKFELNPELEPGKSLQMGQAIGKLIEKLTIRQ